MGLGVIAKPFIWLGKTIWRAIPFVDDMLEIPGVTEALVTLLDEKVVRVILRIIDALDAAHDLTKEQKHDAARRNIRAAGVTPGMLDNSRMDIAIKMAVRHRRGKGRLVLLSPDGKLETVKA